MRGFILFEINFRKFQTYLEIQNESAILYHENRKKVTLWIHLYLLVNGSANGLLQLLFSGRVFNYAFPATSSWVIPNTAYLLGLILFGMGLTLTTEDFKRIAKRPIPVILGTVAHYVIMPGLAWLLCMIFHLKGATAAGVILVGSCPSGTSSSVMAFLSGGDVALDVSIRNPLNSLGPTHDSNSLVILGWSVRERPCSKPLP